MRDAHPRAIVCFGTRPELIKLAPVIRFLRRAEWHVVCVSTGQHREMLDQMLDVFGIDPEYDLHVMHAAQGPNDVLHRVVERMDEVLREIDADVVIVQGDTTTAMACALAATNVRIKVAHVEAGLRSDDIDNPFPEELNRRVISEAAHWAFCPTQRAADRLISERVLGSVHVTGNTVIDALLDTVATLTDADLPPGIDARPTRRRVLVTLHRRESQGEAQRKLARMVRRMSERHDVEVVFPVHLSPAVREQVLPELEGAPNVRVLGPLDYRQFVAVLRTCSLVVSDSGGVQEEAPALDVPVVVLRDTTERPEGVDSGCAVLAGTDAGAAEAVIDELLRDDARLARMAAAPNPYGDGTASARIVAELTAAIRPADLSAIPTSRDGHDRDAGDGSRPDAPKRGRRVQRLVRRSLIIGVSCAACLVLALGAEALWSPTTAVVVSNDQLVRGGSAALLENGRPVDLETTVLHVDDSGQPWTATVRVPHRLLRFTSWTWGSSTAVVRVHDHSFRARAGDHLRIVGEARGTLRAGDPDARSLLDGQTGAVPRIEAHAVQHVDT